MKHPSAGTVRSVVGRGSVTGIGPGSAREEPDSKQEHGSITTCNIFMHFINSHAAK